MLDQQMMHAIERLTYSFFSFLNIGQSPRSEFHARLPSFSYLGILPSSPSSATVFGISIPLPPPHAIPQYVVVNHAELLPDLHLHFADTNAPSQLIGPRLPYASTIMLFTSVLFIHMSPLPAPSLCPSPLILYCPVHCRTFLSLAYLHS